MNTAVSFLYRDACNFKVQNRVIVKGELTKEQAQLIMRQLSEGEYFIPEQVGLPVERFGNITEDDHCWCELREDFYEYTDKAPTVDMSADQLTAVFDAVEYWDDVKYAIGVA